MVLGALLLTGCATGNAEEDAFFRTGWLIPTKLDKEPAVSTPTDDASIGAER